MKRKKVWRYYCEHCKKSGCSAGHMNRHERGCTNNADRICGVCRVIGLEAKPLPTLIAFCKANFRSGNSVSGDPDDCSYFLGKKSVSDLRELAGNCPACMLAALRQSGTYCESGSFDLKAELKSLWADHNAAQLEREYA